MEEIWKPVVGYEWHYEISNLWRVKSFKRWKESILKLSMSSKKYSMAELCKYWLRKKFLASRLVAIHFIDNPDNLPFVLHKKEDLDENGLLYNWEDNLFWWTARDNVIDMYKKWRANNNLQLNNPYKWKFWKDSYSAKKVNQYTKNWEFVKEWWRISDAAKYLNCYGSQISLSCRSNVGVRWFIFKYKT